MMTTNNRIIEFADRLVPISDFSKGKTAQIFDDVKNNNREYIVLKNNQPTALVVSIDSYREMADKALKLDRLLDKIEESRLLAIANERASAPYETTDFDDVISEFGFKKDEIYNGADDVEFE
ncbi:MAG: type II toxin-antitoxin system Phd/YefM family antitoxin [Clostridia bacterium]|nr:type II toxin-antitoxin system Phd/YefM family antitoxin [Clostridia bacterium]